MSELRPDVERAITQSIHRTYPGVAVTPYLEIGRHRRHGLSHRRHSDLGHVGVFIKPNEMFAHGLDERIPAKSFYDGLEHIHDLALTLGGG